ncbi:MAG TPA: hypothetical protein VGL25_10790 [Casimicrobiaceae bacterium]
MDVYLETHRQKEKIAALERTDPELYALIMALIGEYSENPGARADPHLTRLYALAERRYRDTSNPVLSAIADEWGITDEFASRGVHAIEATLRVLRNAALASQTQAYIPAEIKTALYWIAEDKKKAQIAARSDGGVTKT